MKNFCEFLLQILDVDRMLAKSDPDAVELHPDAVVGHPVIRTLYDHLDEITCLEFHPRDQVLVSGSRDCNVKLFDFSKTSAKKAFKTLTVSKIILFLSEFNERYFYFIEIHMWKEDFLSIIFLISYLEIL